MLITVCDNCVVLPTTSQLNLDKGKVKVNSFKNKKATIMGDCILSSSCILATNPGELESSRYPLGFLNTYSGKESLKDMWYRFSKAGCMT